MKYTEVLEMLKTASQDKQAGAGSKLMHVVKTLSGTGTKAFNNAYDATKNLKITVPEPVPRVRKPHIINSGRYAQKMKIRALQDQILEMQERLSDWQDMYAGKVRQNDKLADALGYQMAHSNKLRGRAWKIGLGSVPVAYGAYRLGKINAREGTPVAQPAQPQPGAPGTYEAWMKQHRRSR